MGIRYGLNTIGFNSSDDNLQGIIIKKKKDNQIYAYGIKWNETDDVWDRLGDSISLSDFSTAYPWSKIKRCNVNDSGAVLSYYGESSFKEDGSNGQVMVEYPKTYTKYLYYTINNKTFHEWWVSTGYIEGFKIDQAFLKGAIYTQKFYIGAYEASIYDTSASSYLLNDEQIADFATSTGDKLSSISGAKPASGISQDFTLPNSRILSNNRGSGWGLLNSNQVSFLQKLFMIEYGHANSQSAIGLGVVNKSTGSGNESNITGATSFLGNSSGREVGTNGLTSVSYRGAENMWGNIWTWVDGVNIKANNNLWINTSNQNFSSEQFSEPYEFKGVLTSAGGFVSKLLGTEYGLFPTQTNGSSTTRIPDYYYSAFGDTVACLGGFWIDGDAAGMAYWLMYYSKTFHIGHIGARLSFQL